VTESVLLQDSGVVLTLLHELRGMGLQIALDDFGTGYSSLSYLRSFPFDKIKIDQSFVRGPTGGAGSAAIVDAIVTLASSLGMTTTAEGVETAEQLEQVRRAGCTAAQGYYLGRPRPATDVVADLISNRSPMPA
jgi:EAL domain-containing protein (putative c-di-GMP-specific phosphodiesterase class I)